MSYSALKSDMNTSFQVTFLNYTKCLKIWKLPYLLSQKLSILENYNIVGIEDNIFKFVICKATNILVLNFKYLKSNYAVLKNIPLLVYLLWWSTLI